MKKQTSKLILVFSTYIFGLMACGGGQEMKILDGHYFLRQDMGERFNAPIELEIDSQARLLKLFLGGAKTLELAWTVLPDEEWLEGCQTMHGGVRMEVVNINPANIGIEDINYNNVQLTASCSKTEGVFISDNQDPIFFISNCQAGLPCS